MSDKENESLPQQIVDIGDRITALNEAKKKLSGYIRELSELNEVIKKFPGERVKRGKWIQMRITSDRDGYNCIASVTFQNKKLTDTIKQIVFHIMLEEASNLEDRIAELKKEL
jgi:hypothetical protein